MEKHSENLYQRLIIRASPHTDIWLADDGGHLVQKERGTLDMSLLPGDYIVEFGLGTQTYPIRLVMGSEYSQAEIEAEPPCRRPKMVLGLESKGLIARTAGKSRSIKLLVERAELPELE